MKDLQSIDFSDLSKNVVTIHECLQSHSVKDFDLVQTRSLVALHNHKVNPTHPEALLSASFTLRQKTIDQTHLFVLRSLQKLICIKKDNSITVAYFISKGVSLYYTSHKFKYEMTAYVEMN